MELGVLGVGLHGPLVVAQRLIEEILLLAASGQAGQRARVVGLQSQHLLQPVFGQVMPSLLEVDLTQGEQGRKVLALEGDDLLQVAQGQRQGVGLVRQAAQLVVHLHRVRPRLQHLLPGLEGLLVLA